MRRKRRTPTIVLVFCLSQLSSIICICTAFQPFVLKASVSRAPHRSPPRGVPKVFSKSTWISDQTRYVGLGDQKGTVLAVGDFTCDRYSDLLVVQDSRRMRAVQVLAWNHYEFAFQHVKDVTNTTCHNGLSLDAVPNLSSEARIASAATLDANSDGFLDVLISVQVSKDYYLGILLRGAGNGCLQLDQILADLTPGFLILDANDDMSLDVFFISSSGERVFYINGNNGNFTRKLWRPRNDFGICAPTKPFNSNAFVDINGDCLPDLVVSSSCGLEVWLNEGLHNRSTSRWMIGQEFQKHQADFSELSLPRDGTRIKLLDPSVWDGSSGDGMATFADFNGDGTTDIGVHNSETGELRISYRIPARRQRGKLCKAQNIQFTTKVALKDVMMKDSQLGTTRLQSRFRVGDFNFDSKLDILVTNGETGTIALFEARSANHHKLWFPGSHGLSKLRERLMFSITGINRQHQLSEEVEAIRYEQVPVAILGAVEDPVGAAFFDLDESGRQDIIIPQIHGTRLLWNNLQGFQDSLFFKATAVDSTHAVWRSPDTGLHAFSPMPGNTFKLSYGGRHRREVHVCTQCPQTGFLSLQSCSCIFGITMIANYIEEMAMGGAHGVRTWKNLMPNALAVVWPQHHSSKGVFKWKISYLSKGLDGQMRRIVFVLLATLVILFFAILYAANLEKLEESNKLDIGYT